MTTWTKKIPVPGTDDRIVIKLVNNYPLTTIFLYLPGLCVSPEIYDGNAHLEVFDEALSLDWGTLIQLHGRYYRARSRDIKLSGTKEENIEKLRETIAKSLQEIENILSKSLYPSQEEMEQTFNSVFGHYFLERK